MPVLAVCQCGASYTLKEDYAGQWLKCPQCGQTFQAPGTATTPGVQPQADPAFDRDRFLLRQKHFSVNEKYYVWDEQGQPILFIERPANLGKNLLAGCAGVVAGLVVGGLIGVVAAAMKSSTLQIVFGVLAGVGGLAALFVVAIALYAKRHVYFYRDDSRSQCLLTILQDRKVELLVATYTINDASGNVLARLRKNYLYNIFRKRWDCFAPGGSTMLIAREDSILLSLLRRLIGPLFGVLRTNFIILEGTTDHVVAEFNRQFTILDRYVLQATGDPLRRIDRRVLLALGVLLDTGENR